MIRFIALGDLHINGLPFLSDYVKNPDDMVYKTLAGVVRYAHKHGIKYILQLGDVFHGPAPSQKDQRRLLEFIESSGLIWHVILGNHDISEKGKHSLVLSDFYSRKTNNRLTIYTEPTVKLIDGVPICFLPWPHDKTLLTTPGITCAHITVKGCQTDSGRIMDKGHTIGDKKGMWFLGDVHRQQLLINPHRTWGRYVGTPYQRTFGESLPKGFCDVKAKIDTSGHLKIQDTFVTHTPPYELVNLAISSNTDLDKLAPFDPQNLTLYKLKLAPGYSLPPTFRAQNPHIYDVLDTGRQRPSDSPQNTSKSPSTPDTDDPLALLKPFLAARGLTPQQQDAADQKARTLLKSL